MTQRKKSRSISVLMIIVFSAMLPWALIAVLWSVPVVYADDPEVITITVTSSLESYFYDPGLDPTGGTVYFNSVGGEGAGQVLTVTAICSGTIGSSTFEGAPAFGDTPPLDTSAPWQVTYTVEAEVGPQNGVVFTVTNSITETDTAVITFTEDNVNPGLPTSPQARPDGYADTGEYDDDTLIYFTWAAASDNTGGSGIATYYAEIGDPTPDEDAGGDFQDVDAGLEGFNPYYVAAVDHVGNVGPSTSDIIIVDLADPVITAVTVTSDNPIYFFNRGLGVTGGEVFFNSLEDEGGEQAVTVTVSWTDANPCSLEGDTAFDDSPSPDTSGPPWTVSYSVENNAPSQTNRVFTVTDRAGHTDTTVITFIQDNTGPIITSPYINDYDSEYLHVVASTTVYYGDDMGSAQTFTVHGHSSDEDGVGLNVTDTVDFSSALGDNPSNLGTPEDWWGEYTAARYNTGDGVITVTVYDLLNNPATQVFTYLHDTSNPIVQLTDVTNPDYNPNGDELNAPNWYRTSGLTPGWAFTSTVSDSGSGPGSTGATWNHSTNNTDRFTDPGIDGDGVFTGVANDSDGAVTVTLNITDNVGNAAGDMLVIRLDGTAPIVPGNFTYQDDSDSGGDGFSPQPGYYDDTEIQLQWDASNDGDGSGLHMPPYCLGIAPQPTCDTYYSEDSPYDVGSNGTYTIYLTAEDNVGNISEDTVTGTVIVDTQAPQGSVDFLDSTTELSFVLDWSATTDQGPAGLRSTDPYSVSYNIDNGDWQDWITTTSAITDTFGPTSPITVEHDHTYCFRLRAVDKAGNVAYTDGNDCTETYSHTQKVSLPIIVKGYCGPDNYEPNDSCNQAHGPLISNQTYQSWISGCDLATYKKSDYFYIDISTTKAINIYLTNIPAGTDYDLCLYRNPSDDPDDPADRSRNHGNTSETISYSPSTTGRYYIRVYSDSGSSSSPYSLRVIYD